MSLLAALIAGPTLVSAPAPATVQDVDFRADVQPILEARCYECHGPEKQKGKLRLDVDAGMFDDDLGVIVRGDAEGSLLYEMIALPAGDPDIMPEEGDPLTAEQIATIRAWIEQGASFEDTLVEVAADPLALPPLTAEQAAARDAALEALAQRGVHPLPVAQGMEALDLNVSLLRGKAGDAEAALVAGLEPVLVWANFSGTALGDAGLQALGRCGELRTLNLSRTSVTDAGLAQLAGLAKLEVLNLYGTAVGDQGLAQLRGLKALRKLFLWDTAVTDEGVERLVAALPGLVVNRGAELVAVEPAPAPANAECPVSGQPLGEARSTVAGVLVGFCCEKCKATFDADPAAFAEKVPGLAEALAKVPINAKCPVSGEPVNPECTSVLDGKTVAFCCGNCKAKFDAAPDEFREKLGLGK